MAAGLAMSSAANAQDSFTFFASAMGGFSGSFDSSGEGFGHDAWQLAAGMVTSDRTLTMVRAGKLELGDQQATGLTHTELRYAIVAGEYRFRTSAYDTGVFVGIGTYRLRGDLPGGGSSHDSAIGAALGFTGDFDVTRHFSLVGELDFHYAFLEQTQFYGAALVGVAVHF